MAYELQFTLIKCTDGKGVGCKMQAGCNWDGVGGGECLERFVKKNVDKNKRESS